MSERYRNRRKRHQLRMNLICAILNCKIELSERTSLMLYAVLKQAKRMTHCQKLCLEQSD